MTKTTLVDFEKHMPDYLALLNATRKLGHSVESAIADLIDNGLDAQASDVHVYFTEEQRNEKQVRNDGRSIISISIADNGTGMNKFQLHKALIPASTGRVRNTKTQSGFFGMGLLASGLALGNHVDVYTRGEDGAEAAGFDTDRVEAARLLERLGGSGQRELLDAVGTSSLLRVLEVRGRVPLLDLE